MRNAILELLIATRLLTNDGFFLEVRRTPIKHQSPEVRIAIRRPWKRGRKFSR